MAIQGTLEEAPLPDVIQLLSLGRKTGCLALTEREMQGEICLDRGRVCHAAVFGRRDRLGDMLIRTGRVTRQQLEVAIAEQRVGGKRVSQTFIESGQLEQTELELFVRRQVEDAVYFMFTWRTGTFAFTSSVRPKHQDVLVSIDPEGLLLEGARRVDEWSLIEKKIPSLDLVFRLDRAHLDAARPTLTPEQEQLLPLLDGSRDVNALIEITDLAEFAVGKALFGLITAGFATRVERRSALRHLDYRELLAYVVREAEFADAARRRAAARHIADCVTCTQRLKTIHVRRTGAVPAFSPHTTPDADAVAAPAPLAPDGIERRATDRRSGGERRADERRHAERRRARSPEWARPGRDRRNGRDRRAEGRRVAERRLGSVALAARAVAVPPRTRGRDPRSTGPRRIRTQGADSTDPRRNTGGGIRLRPADEVPAPTVEPAAASGGPENVSAVPEAGVEAAPAEAPDVPTPRLDPDIPDPPDVATVEVTPAPPPPTADADDVPRRPLPASVMPNPRPEPRRPGARTADIEWLVSPAEADNLLRTSRSGLAGPAPAQPARPPSAGPGEKADETSPVRTPAAAPREMAREPEPAHRYPITRWVAVAAAVVVLAGVGWTARPFLGMGGAAPRPAAAPVSPLTAPAITAAEPPPETGTQVGGEAVLAPAPQAERERIPRPARQPSALQAEETPVPPPVVTQAAPAPPAVGGIRGVARDARSGLALAGVRVTIPGTAFTATTDAAGAFALPDVPAGQVSLAAAGDGYLPGSRAVVVEAGGTALVEFTLATPVPVPAAEPMPVPAATAPAAREPDDELAAAGWTVSDAAAAAAQLRDRVATIPDLWIESIATLEAGSRPRVRVALLTPSGERIVLTETRSGAPVLGGTPRVTALRIIPATEAYPVTTGTASFGSLLVTAKTTLPGDTLRALLAKLAPLE